MELSSVPKANGKPDFDSVKNFDKIYLTCTERECAAIVGISRAYAHRLKNYGVLETNGVDGRQARILLPRSLREYRKFLTPDKRGKLDSRLMEMGYWELL